MLRHQQQAHVEVSQENAPPPPHSSSWTRDNASSSSTRSAAKSAAVAEENNTARAGHSVTAKKVSSEKRRKGPKREKDETEEDETCSVNEGITPSLCSFGTSSVNGEEPCQPCPAGEYAPREGMCSCLPCPSGTSTNTTGSDSETACIDVCQPGSFSEVGVEPCTLCPVGQYQADFAQMQCDVNALPDGILQVIRALSAPRVFSRHYLDRRYATNATKI
ncbi:hypothetical protein ScPMuIL_015431 [Solemya velum]